MFLFLLLARSNTLWGGRMVIALLSFPYIIVKAKNIVKGLLYLCPQILFMAGKYIKIVTFLALIIIVVIQGVWLANTYRLVESRLSSASARLFPRAVVDEAWERLNSLAGETGEREPLGTSMNYKDMDGLLGLFDHMAIYLNEYNDSVYQSEISLPLLDSIFTASLSKEGFHAKLVCEVVDSFRSLEHGAYRGGAGGYRQSLLGDYPSDGSFVDCYGSVDPFCGRMRYLSGEDYYPAG